MDKPKSTDVIWQRNVSVGLLLSHEFVVTSSTKNTCFLFCPFLLDFVDRCLIIVPTLTEPELKFVSRERKCDKPL